MVSPYSKMCSLKRNRTLDNLMLEPWLIYRDDKFKESFYAKWNKGSVAFMTKPHPDKLQINKIEMSKDSSSKTKGNLFNKGKQHM